MPTITLRASGAQAPDDMKVGEWVVRCEHGQINRRGNKISAVLNFSVLGRQTDHGFIRENEGVVLKQWYFLDKVDPYQDEIVLDIHPHSKYGVAWALAAGRPLKSSDNPDPKAFVGKIFRVDVGYRSDAGGSFSYRNTGTKKSDRDFLRIHSIIEKIEEKALSHMGPYGAINMLHEHEHDTRTLALTPTLASTQAATEHDGIRMKGASHMSNERVPQGHANQAPGTGPQNGKKGVTYRDALRVFPGAKVVKQ